MRPRTGTSRTTVRLVAVLSTTLALVLGAAGWAAAASVRGLWHLNETSGSVVDSSGNGNHGTNRGATRGVDGYSGTAYRFGVGDSWVEVPNDSTLNPGSADFAVTARVNLDRVPAAGQTYDIVRKGLSGTAGGEFKLEIAPGGRVTCIAKDATKRIGVVTSARVDLVGEWHQVGCALVGSSWRVTVDGRTTAKTVPFGSISNTRSLTIGSKYGQEDGTQGRIDEVRLSIG